MASAQKRSNGKWMGRYRGPDGKERGKVFARKGDALRWAQAQESRVRAMDWTDPSRAKITIGDWAQEWCQTLQIKPKTRLSYLSLLRTCVLPTWGSVQLSHVTTPGVKSWMTGMVGGRGRPVSASRRRQAYHLLAAMLDAAVQDGRLPRNPARPNGLGRRSGLLPALPVAAHRRYLRHEELHRLANEAGDYRGLILVLGYCGLRWGEASALRVRSVDLLRGRITVTEAVADVGGELVWGSPKTHAARTVPLPAFIRELLAECMGNKGPADLLFTSPAGGPLRHANFRNRVFIPAAERAGLEGVTLHELRHAAASLAVSAGANVKAVQRMLGHKDAAMTLNVYADLFDDELDAVASRLDEAVLRARADSLRTGDGLRAVALSPAGA